MSMKRFLRLAAALCLAGAIAMSAAVTSSATFFKPGDAAELSEALGEGPYAVVVEKINTLVLRIKGCTLLNPAWNSTPFSSVVIDEAAEDSVILTGGAKTLEHLQITVDEDEKTIVIGMPDTMLWWFAGSSVHLTIGAPVSSLTISESNDVSITYKDASVSEFYLETNGPIDSECSFANDLTKLTAKILNNGDAVFSGTYAAEVEYNLTGRSTLYAYELPVKLAKISTSGSSIAKQFFVYDPEDESKLISRISGYSEVWYHYPRYDLAADPDQKFPLAGPNVTDTNVALGTRLVEQRVKQS